MNLMGIIKQRTIMISVWIPVGHPLHRSNWTILSFLTYFIRFWSSKIIRNHYK